MIKIEKTITPSPEQWEALILGARNAMNSWDRYDSGVGCLSRKYWDHIEKGPLMCANCPATFESHCVCNGTKQFVLGPNDYKLVMSLSNAGTDHRKYMRMITVYVDITAPLYWWKEFDTYKVGTVANSCSTMHKIHEKEFTLEDFSCEHLINERSGLVLTDRDIFPRNLLGAIVSELNKCRALYLETKDKKYWWQMIQLLPSSYNQKRTVMLNYEVLANMYKSRKAHKLDEWVEFCKWIESLPYSELITGGKEE
jgi:hypothetical protein